nr:uncharacterized protein LOC109173096 [Ipomoea trifida]
MVVTEVDASVERQKEGVKLNVPARTVALLLDTALRIQKQQQAEKKPGPQIKDVCLGLFGSILK